MMIFLTSPVLVYSFFIFHSIKKTSVSKKEGNIPIPTVLTWLPDPEKNKLSCSKNILLILMSPFIAAFWPIRMKILEAWLYFKYQTTTEPTESLKWKQESTNVSRDAGLIMLAEVCLEATFSSVLNWYLILPGIIEGFASLETVKDIQNHPIGKISFLSSIITLSWSYTAYNADKKAGVLSITANPVGRLTIFLSNLLLIFARMNCLVWFAFSFGPGEIKQLYICLILHVILMAAIHFIHLWKTGRINKIRQWQDLISMKSKLIRICFVCLINGLANIFIVNLVYVSFNKEKLLEKKFKESFKRQTIGDSIFLLENITCIAFGVVSATVAPLNDTKVRNILILIIVACHFLGLMLKIIYYKYLHMWSELTPEFLCRQGKFRRKFKITSFYQNSPEVEMNENS